MKAAEKPKGPTQAVYLLIWAGLLALTALTVTTPASNSTCTACVNAGPALARTKPITKQTNGRMIATRLKST